jgi:hypothetical protein
MASGTLRTPAFPPYYGDPLIPSAPLQAALDRAIAAGPGSSWRVGLAIAALEQAGAHPVAHVRGDREYFGASVLKVAALYALCELRTTLRAIAQELGTTTSRTELLARAASHCNPQILAALAQHPALRGISHDVALPQYATAFRVADAGGGRVSVEFADAFAPEAGAPTHEPVGHIEQMIVVSDNTSAARCIHACGYGYLNGALAAAGLLEPGAKPLGIWLAGDYLDSGALPKYPMCRIPSDNDDDVAQASTALHLARLMALLFDGALFAGQADTRDLMMRVLAKAAAYPEVYLDRASGMDDLDVTHNKLGVAALKPKNGGHDVESEVSLVQHKPSGRRFAVAWLNYDVNLAGWEPIGHVVRDTIAAYLQR